MDVPDLFITWSHTYTSDDIVEVPGFTVSVPSVVSAGVYVQVGITPEGDELRVTVGALYKMHDQSWHFIDPVASYTLITLPSQTPRSSRENLCGALLLENRFTA